MKGVRPTEADPTASRTQRRQRREADKHPEGHGRCFSPSLEFFRHLTDVLKEALTQLPTRVRELVEKIAKPPPETEKDMATWPHGHEAQGSSLCLA